MLCQTYIVKNDQRTIDAADCVVCESRLDTAHAMVYFSHVGGLRVADEGWEEWKVKSVSLLDRRAIQKQVDERIG